MPASTWGRADAGPAIPAGRGRRVLPFWLLQAAELLGTMALADLSLHVARGGLLVAGAGVLAALAVTARGPLGIVRLVGRRLHVTLAAAAGVALGLAPVAAGLRPDLEGIVIVEFAAVGLVRLSTLTRVEESPRPGRPGGTARRGRAGPVGPVIDATATEVAGGPPATVSGGSPPVTAATAARWAGRATGAAARAAGRHRPEAEARARRALRSAGRMAGRAGARRAGQGRTGRASTG